MKKTYYSNGKLLITGEYVVLDGAKALALPTKFGQYLIIEPGKNQQIIWKSFDSDKSIWFEDTITFSEITNLNLSEVETVKSTLVRILRNAYLQNPNFITKSEGYVITTELTFPRLWGLGTSSTLINNIAQWLEIDAFDLLKNSFGGSGYDIACAQNNSAILYQLINEKPIVEKVVFNPDFAGNCYFVYLNKKQSSKTAIASYFNKRTAIGTAISELNQITNAVLKAPNLENFMTLLETHEVIISHVLEMKTIKETLFFDFNGVIKSLGAWGGDFVLVVSKENPTAYFKSKGFETIITYKDMILTQTKNPE
jgi:mevalonate kinase